MAKVDIILPVRNGELYLQAAVESIIAQSSTDWRLLILDHGSTDSSAEIADRLAEGDRRIEVHRLAEIDGLSALRNHGLKLSNAPYVMCQDADDISVPQRIARQVELLESRPELAIVGSNYITTDADGIETGEVTLPLDSERLAVAAIFSNPVAQPTVMMNVARLQELDAQYSVHFLKGEEAATGLRVENFAEDYFLFGQLAILGKCANLPDQLVRYRLHGSNVGMTKFTEQMLTSLEIARNLMAYICAAQGVAFLDPAPFCNFGGQLFDVVGFGELGALWRAMEALLTRHFGPSGGLSHELAYRRSLATRSSIGLLYRHIAFCTHYRPDADQRAALREWFVGPLRGRSRFKISA